MMKLIIKAFVTAMLFTVMGVMPVSAAGGIKSAEFNSNKVILDASNLNLGGQRMIWVVKDGEQNASNYMPVRGVLEAMGYTVSWDAEQKAVIVTSPLYEKKPQKPDMTDTILPTKELLNGAWTAVYSWYDGYYPESGMKCYFSSDGTYILYTEDGYSESVTYDGGKYSIDKDIISMTYEFTNDEILTDDEIETGTLQCRFSKNGSVLYLNDPDYPDDIVTFVKDDGAEFAGKVDGFVPKGIKSAEFNSNKVILDGKELDIGGQQMIWVVKEGEQNASNYMPVRGVLEAMGYELSWDGAAKAVYVSSDNKPAAPKPPTEETIAPTKELLNGYWAATDYYNNTFEKYGDYATDYYDMKYYFDLDGNFGYYVDLSGSFAYYLPTDFTGEYSVYAKGAYIIGEDIITIKITYMDEYGEKMTFTGDDIIELTATVRFSKDGSKMFATDFDDEEVLITFVKDEGAEFKKYQ